MVVKYSHTLVTEKFLVPYNLKNSKLVIDGNCISIALGNKMSYLNHKHFQRFDVRVRSFLGSLRGLNVTPIIVFYGGSQDCKLKTIVKRTKEDIKAAKKGIDVTHMSTMKPILAKEIMKQVAKEMNIKCVQSLIETDRDIASIAKILRCPVLSNNSDFFLYGVDWIPHSTFKVPFLECKIYRFDHISVHFAGLHAETIPLLNLLMGDEILQRGLVSNLRILRRESEQEDESYEKICDALEWLKNHTLESAISEILNNLREPKPPDSLKKIERVLNKFTRVTPSMLPSLGYSGDQINNLIEGLPLDPYKYSNPQDVSDTPEEDWEQDRPDFLDIGEGLLTVTPADADDVCLLAPVWFIKEFRAADFPSFFIDMMARQLYVCGIQLEDFSEPTCIQTSLRIIKVIFALLNAGTQNSNILRYVARGSGTEVKVYELNCSEPVPGLGIPPLESLRSCHRNILQDIFVKTMGISREFLDEFPPEWAVYMATVKYWQKESNQRFTRDCFLYSLLMSIIYSVVTEQNYQFRDRYTSSRNPDIDSTLRRVTAEDRKRAKNAFWDILKGKPAFDLEGVHALSLFENCLKHSFHLNALLNRPYPEMNIAKLYDDSVIYKTYLRLKDQDDVFLSVRSMIGGSRSLESLISVIKRKLSAPI